MDAETTEATEPEIDYRAELEKTRKALRDANREAADRRKRLEAFEAEEAKRKEASMSELEKAQAQLSEWQQKAAEAERSRRDALVRAAVIAAASGKGFADTEDALRFIDTASLDVDDAGFTAAINEQLDGLAKNKPYLLKQTESGGQIGATNPGRGGACAAAQQPRAPVYGLLGGKPFRGPGGGLILPS